jgi:hydrogenase maturation protease
MILLIAYGNPLRRDDGAGLRLAEEMAGRWQEAGTPLRHVVAQQLTPELAVEIADPDVLAVVFVDTRAEPPGGAADGVLVSALGAGGPASPSLGHHTAPEVLLAYASLLLDGRSAPPAWLATTPGVDFDHGEGLSPAASAAIRCAFSQPDHELMRLLDSLRRATSADIQPSLQFSETSEVAAAGSTLKRRLPKSWAEQLRLAKRNPLSGPPRW